MEKLNKIKNKIIIFGILLLVIVIFIIGCIEKIENNKEKLITSSTLTNIVEISELSTAEYEYNGIAEVYKDESNKKIKCYIKYKALVKAKIDINDIILTKDEINKVLNVELPEMTLDTSIICDSSEDFSFIPNEVKIELDEIMLSCKNDVTKETLEAEGLLKVAEKNLKDKIEAFLYPILNTTGYMIMWK